MEEKKSEPPKKVQLLALSYYARKDIQKAMFEFCKNRETVPRYLEGFGKRPDCFDYPNDIFIAAKKGATSFHCSEEIWEDPLKINTNMTPDEYNEIKIGWDFLIDIDSKYLDYSKIAAKLLIDELEKHGIKHYGIKFSGSKGFHILVPFKAFPRIFGDETTKDKFPEWPRLIASYLFDRIKEPMNQSILKLTSRDQLEEKGELISEHTCPKCKGPTIKKKIGIYKCPNFHCRAEVKSMKSNREKMICPSCNDWMNRVEFDEVVYCENCKLSSAQIEAQRSGFGVDLENTPDFKEEITTKSTQDSIDIVLVASRHLFRAPYSLHEKTAFASIVLTKAEIENFKPTDADPFKIKEPLSFMPASINEEAKELLFQALDNQKHIEEKTKKYEGEGVDLSGLTITEEMFPPIIKKLNKGIQDDGRKRALYILLSFYNSLQFPQDYIEEKIEEWNKKNRVPLKDGYIRSQIFWFSKRKPLPPNYSNPIYKDFGITGPPEPGMKNPINYTIKKAMRNRAKSGFNNKPSKNSSEL